MWRCSLCRQDPEVIGFGIVPQSGVCERCKACDVIWDCLEATPKTDYVGEKPRVTRRECIRGRT